MGLEEMSGITKGDVSLDMTLLTTHQRLQDGITAKMQRPQYHKFWPETVMHTSLRK